MKRLEVWVALGLVLLSGCLFDGSPLESRQCAEGGVCPDGQTCVGGYCVLDDFLEPDADTPDISTPPPTPDADDSLDVPPTDDVVAPPDADEPCVPTAELCDGMDNDCDEGRLPWDYFGAELWEVERG